MKSTLKLTKRLDDPNGIVSKLVFENEKLIAETVAYHYEDRGVVCFSVQSGCPIGCQFCGTGKRFLGNLTFYDMKYQIEEALKVIGPKKKIQIMAMSMGEPMTNWNHVSPLITWMLLFNPNYDIYISTVGLNNPTILSDMIKLAKAPQFGLQFSLHNDTNFIRKEMLGNYPDLLSIEQLRLFGAIWTQQAGRPCYFNYIATGRETDYNAQRIYNIVKGMHLTCSIMCNNKEFKKASTTPATRLAEKILAIGDEVEVSVFDPAGQDTIGGGCGQLLYVQERMKEMSSRNIGQKLQNAYEQLPENFAAVTESEKFKLINIPRTKDYPENPTLKIGKF